MNTAQQGSTLRRHLLSELASESPLPPPSFPLIARKCSILLKYQNVFLAGLALRPPLHQNDRNTFLEAVACICERREWREYARGMYDKASFSEFTAQGNIIESMIAAIEGSREHERMRYHCVSIAMECMSKKNSSGTAVEYCGRVLGIKLMGSC